MNWTAPPAAGVEPAGAVPEVLLVLQAVAIRPAARIHANRCDLMRVSPRGGSRPGTVAVPGSVDPERLPAGNGRCPWTCRPRAAPGRERSLSLEVSTPERTPGRERSLSLDASTPERTYTPDAFRSL